MQLRLKAPDEMDGTVKARMGWASRPIGWLPTALEHSCGQHGAPNDLHNPRTSDFIFDHFWHFLIFHGFPVHVGPLFCHSTANFDLMELRTRPHSHIDTPQKPRRLSGTIVEPLIIGAVCSKRYLSLVQLTWKNTSNLPFASLFAEKGCVPTSSNTHERVVYGVQTSAVHAKDCRLCCTINRSISGLYIYIYVHWRETYKTKQNISNHVSQPYHHLLSILYWQFEGQSKLSLYNSPATEPETWFCSDKRPTKDLMIGTFRGGKATLVHSQTASTSGRLLEKIYDQTRWKTKK